MGFAFQDQGKRNPVMGSGDCSGFSGDGRLGKQTGIGKTEAGPELRGMALASGRGCQLWCSWRLVRGYPAVGCPDYCRVLASSALIHCVPRAPF